MKYTILGAPLSPFVRKVRVLCSEKDIPYELKPVNPFAPPDWFLAVSPLKRIPVLAIETDADAIEHLADSSAICAMLEQAHPQPPLLPADPIERGKALWYEEYGDTALVSLMGPGIFQPVVLARMMGREPDHDKAQRTLETDLPPLFDYLEGVIGDRAYLVGDALTLADISIATPFVNMQHAGLDVDAARWPRLAAFLQRILERPSFAGCVSGERAMLG